MAPPRKPAEPESEASEPASDQVEEQEVPTVTQALSRVMGDVQSISKNSRNTSQNFNFRGIDAVMNAVGPALRAHGVVVVPVNTRYESEHYQTRQGANMKNVTLTVIFRFYGPAGDHIDATATGEAADAGDKAMPKAHSVAFRTMLLQALCIPTDEPDPDLEAHDRAAQPFKEGATARDPQPRRDTAVQPTYNFPKDWRELGQRLGSLLGAEEAPIWIAQAVEVDAGSPLAVSDLDESARRHVWETLTKVLRSLDEDLKIDPGAFPPPSRKEIADAFAKHLDGAVLAGPSWALDGTEAENGFPAKDEVLGSEATESAQAPGGEHEPSGAETPEGQTSLN